MTVPVHPEVLAQVLTAVAAVVRELRLATGALVMRLRPGRPVVPYETVWLDIVLELEDPRGERAVLTRRQRIRVLADGGMVVRELVWGEGDQLVRYHARGARRLAVRAEGSRRAVLLDPEGHPAAGDRLTIASRRRIRGGFRGRSEYCEAFLERPTGRVDLTVIFPPTRPPTTAHLIQATTEAVLRTVPVRYRADGRAVLRCRLRHPDPAITYSLRWSW